MKNIKRLWLWLCLVLLGLVSCQKVVVDDIVGTGEVEDGVAIRFNVTKIEQIPFPSPMAVRATDVKEACNKVSLAVYKDGTKVSQVNQESSDSKFGDFQLVLSPGTYKIVVIAHSGMKNPTMTDMQKITFDGKVTDTFYYSGDFTVDDAASYNLELKRAVAMFRMITTDNIPAGVAKMQFYYTGGSSTFDAVQGVGCVNSRQTEVREVTADMIGKPGTFEVYTFPKTDSNVLDMKVTAFNASNVMMLEKVFSEVEIQRNMITQYTGNFFDGSSVGNGEAPGTFNFLIGSKDEWTQTSKTY